MRSRIVFLLLLGSTAAALAQGALQVGDRVHIELNDKDGTVIGINGMLGNGAQSLKVHVDGAAYPENVGVTYDSITNQVTKIGHVATAAPAPPANPPQLPTPGFAINQLSPRALPVPTIQSSGGPKASIQAGPATIFRPGDRLHIIRSGKDCTVLEVQQRLYNGGYMLKVHEDGAGYASNQGVVIDTGVNPVSLISHGALPSPGAAQPMASGPVNANNQAPGRVAPSDASCQQAIRANHPASGADQTINVKFLEFQSSGLGAYVERYQGGSSTGGHPVKAMSIHARYQVLTHFADPYADDQLRTYDAHFKCYNHFAGGELTAEMTDRLPGGEHAEYIKKR